MNKLSLAFKNRLKFNEINKKRLDRKDRNILNGHSFSEKRNPQKRYKIKPFVCDEESGLFYKNGKTYREMKLEKFQVWKKLYDKGIHVEPILDFKYFKKSKLYKYLENASIAFEKPDVLITSEPVGYSLFGTAKMNSKNTIIHFINKGKIKMNDNQRLSIARQIVTLIKAVWKEGYVHGHAHGGNWTVKFNKGEPIVYLIDFDKIQKISSKPSDTWMNKTNLEKEKENIFDIVNTFLSGTKYENELNKFHKIIFK
jgi:tRNA A-37 threonylcarbamoyl transferase component Bud32